MPSWQVLCRSQLLTACNHPCRCSPPHRVDHDQRQGGNDSGEVLQQGMHVALDCSCWVSQGRVPWCSGKWCCTQLSTRQPPAARLLAVTSQPLPIPCKGRPPSQSCCLPGRRGCARRTRPQSPQRTTSQPQRTRRRWRAPTAARAPACGEDDAVMGQAQHRCKGAEHGARHTTRETHHQSTTTGDTMSSSVPMAAACCCLHLPGAWTCRSSQGAAQVIICGGQQRRRPKCQRQGGEVAQRHSNSGAPGWVRRSLLGAVKRAGGLERWQGGGRSSVGWEL